jgi:hypothetical protein
MVWAASARKGYLVKQYLLVCTPVIIGASVLVLITDVFVIGFRLLGFSHGTADYAGVLVFLLIATFRMRRTFRPENYSVEEITIVPKQSVLPPPTQTQKREVSVNLHFNSDVYERIKVLAEFSGTSVAALLHYVTVNTVLPLMEREMSKKQSDAPTKPAKSDPAPVSSSMLSLPPESVEK